MLTTFSKNEILLVIAIAVVLGYVLIKVITALLRKRNIRPLKTLDFQDHYQAIDIHGNYQKKQSSEGSAETDDVSENSDTIEKTELTPTKNLNKYQKLTG